jgi:hypothetical protein
MGQSISFFSSSSLYFSFGPGTQDARDSSCKGGIMSQEIIDKKKELRKIENEKLNTDEEGETFKTDLMTPAEYEVRENEDASLQDNSYAFDEDNTGDEDFHDVDDDTQDNIRIDFDNDEDYVV